MYVISLSNELRVYMIYDFVLQLPLQQQDDKEEVLLLVLLSQYLSVVLLTVQLLQTHIRDEALPMCDTVFREYVLFIVCETIR